MLSEHEVNGAPPIPSNAGRLSGGPPGPFIAHTFRGPLEALVSAPRDDR